MTEVPPPVKPEIKYTQVRVFANIYHDIESHLVLSSADDLPEINIIRLPVGCFVKYRLLNRAAINFFET